MGSPVFKTGGGSHDPRRVRFPSASAKKSAMSPGQKDLDLTVMLSTQGDRGTVQYNRTKATILCRCGLKWELCVSVGLEVPEALWCSPGEPIAKPNNARSDICCPKCRSTPFSGDPELKTRVENELRRGVGGHVHRGTVVVDCR